MPRIKRPEGYKVKIIESERGFGQKIDDIIYYDNEQEAKIFVEIFNSQNNEEIVPDWYMRAEYCGKI